MNSSVRPPQGGESSTLADWAQQFRSPHEPFHIARQQVCTHRLPTQSTASAESAFYVVESGHNCRESRRVAFSNSLESNSAGSKSYGDISNP